MFSLIKDAHADTMTGSASLIDTLLTKDMIFAAFCVGLLFVIYKMVQLGDKKSQEHANQIERIYKENDGQQKSKDEIHAQTIDRMTKQFTESLDKLMLIAQNERKDATNALRELTSSFNRVIERRGTIEPRDHGMGEK